MRIPSLLLAASTAAFGALLLAPAGDAASRPSYYNLWRDLYPGSASGPNVVLGVGTSCQLCHSTPSGGNGWNSYGWDIRQHILTGLTTTQAIVAIEGLDSDLDPSGSTNLEEIQADTQPGWRVGPHNTIFFSDGSTNTGEVAPEAILGDLDPGQPATPFCPGDGTGNACPCFNEGEGGHGCQNSTGAGGLLEASGTSSVAAADLVFEGSKLVPGAPGLYFQGDSQLGGGAGNLFGDGLRCAGIGVVRLQVVIAGGTGSSATSVDLAAVGGAAPGQTKFYQLWYRDPVASPCGSGFNTTNALEVSWMP